MKRLALLSCVAITLAGCGGLRPLYGGGASGPVQSTLSAVELAPIEGKAGWLVTNALRDRLHKNADSAAVYRLEIKLDDRITGLGVRRDDSVARERRTLRARYQLVELRTGLVVLDDTAGSDAGIDVVGSEYATIAAENTALERLSGTLADQIVARIARFATARPLPGASE